MVEGLKFGNSSFKQYFSKKIGNTYCDIKSYKYNYDLDYSDFKKWFLMIWDNKEEYLNNHTDRIYKKLNFVKQTSTLLLQVSIVNILLFYVSSFLKKK